MSLSLTLHLPATPTRPAGCLEFHNDGQYWFLHPWFETIAHRTGKYIDLYGDVILARDDFSLLRTMFRDARKRLSTQPAAFEVCVGRQTHPTVGDLYRTVQKAELTALLDQFEALVEEAEREGGWIECLGD